MAKANKRKWQLDSRLRASGHKKAKAHGNRPPVTGQSPDSALSGGSQSPKDKVPFGRKDNILLVGEGDFSFALSLFATHRCRNITATSYDDEQALVQKYPEVNFTLNQLHGDQPTKDNTSDTARDHIEPEAGGIDEEEEWQGISSSGTSDQELDRSEATPLATGSSHRHNIKIVHSVDARKLGGLKSIRQHGPFDKIVFNFPHVGGITKDVNRQVRLNQELLVAFFKSSKGLLAGPERPNPRPEKKQDTYDSDDDEDEDKQDQLISLYGQVILTVFEGEPYSLWNVRDLARHSGYKVVESFRFPWRAYPGYKHARTLGDVQGIERDDEKRSGAWRGEEREARMFIFEANDSHDKNAGAGRRRPKGQKDGDSDSE